MGEGVHSQVHPRNVATRRRGRGGGGGSRCDNRVAGNRCHCCHCVRTARNRFWHLIPFTRAGKRDSGQKRRASIAEATCSPIAHGERTRRRAQTSLKPRHNLYSHVGATFGPRFTPECQINNDGVGRRVASGPSARAGRRLCNPSLPPPPPTTPIPPVGPQTSAEAVSVSALGTKSRAIMRQPVAEFCDRARHLPLAGTKIRSEGPRGPGPRPPAPGTLDAAQVASSSFQLRSPRVVSPRGRVSLLPPRLRNDYATHRGTKGLAAPFPGYITSVIRPSRALYRHSCVALHLDSRYGGRKTSNVSPDFG